MSQQLISRSPDLKRLQDEGYDIEIRAGFLLVKGIPYLNARKDVLRGTLVSKLLLAGDRTTRPENDHVAYFIGEYPCYEDGTPIAQIGNSSEQQRLADGVIVNHTFSAKPKPEDTYPDYYRKVVTYGTIISGPAQSIDPSAKPQTFKVIVSDADKRNTPFNYIDTASSRAEIDVVTDKLKRLSKIAIIGLGGTGSYVLDLVAKTPVWEIHLYDADRFLQHNAFRSPGAPTVEDLQSQPTKVAWFKSLYSKMHSGINDHAVYVNEANIDELRAMDFVFICIDSGDSKKFVVEKLEAFNKPFIDVGLGVEVRDEALLGIVRTTSSTPQKRDHLKDRVSFDDRGNNDYNRNIQIADLNALNAALAVIKWKKFYGFYKDLKNEHHSQFQIATGKLLNEDFLE